MRREDFTFSTKPPTIRDTQAYFGWVRSGDYHALVNLIYLRCEQPVARDDIYAMDLDDAQILGRMAVAGIQIGDLLSTLSIVWEYSGDRWNEKNDHTFAEAVEAKERELGARIDLRQIVSDDPIVTPEPLPDPPDEPSTSRKEMLKALWSNYLQDSDGGEGHDVDGLGHA